MDVSAAPVVTELHSTLLEYHESGVDCSAATCDLRLAVGGQNSLVETREGWNGFADFSSRMVSRSRLRGSWLVRVLPGLGELVFHIAV